MSIPEFNVKEQWIGDGTLAVYTFDFTIQDLEHLLIIVQDDAGAQIQKVRGSDTSYLSGVVFDAVDGGGTVTLLAVLPDQYTITFLMANDIPTQPTQFINKFSFTLRSFELALDFIVCQIQRLFYLTNRSIKLDDLDDNDDFDTTLPPDAEDNPGSPIVVNSDGDGFAWGTQIGAIAGGLTVSGSRAVPTNIIAVNGLTWTGPNRQVSFIQGSGGAVIVSKNPQIAAGAAVGNELTLVGCDATKTVQLADGTGLSLRSTVTLGLGSTLGLVWDGTYWNEIYRSV